MQTTDTMDENVMTESLGNDIYMVYESDLNVRMKHALGLPKNFIRFITKFEVEPAKLSVVATDN